MRKALILVAVTAIDHAVAFNLPGLTDIFKPPTPSSASANDESQLLQAISNTGYGKDADLDTQAKVLSIVRRMEKSAPPSPTLLSNPDEAKILDGAWYLQYTAPSEIEGGDEDKWVAVDAAEGETNIETRQFKQAGAVSGGGIKVDASKSPAKQSIDVENSRVMNEIMAGIGQVTVGGSFRQSTSVPNRAIVAFDTAKIGPIDIGFLFDIRAAIQGSKESGWLEVTYISKDLRIGRGNKGSLFVLTRDRDAVEA